jgi:hypothetical protein
VAGEQPEAPLVPILVDGSGRDGTTLLMQLLGTSAEIAFDRTYPYEQRYFSYLLHWSQLPTLPSWDEERWNLDSLAHSDILAEAGVVGPIPWGEHSLIAGDSEPDVWREIFDSVWSTFSRRARQALRSRLGDEELAIRFYAQKNASSWALPLDRLPDLRLVCLLRDPRDVWLSSVAFHERRAEQGDAFLPVGPGGSVEDVLEEFLDDQKERLRWLAKAESERGIPIVRYESLVADLPGEAKRLGEWLGIHLDAEAVLRRRGQYSEHITSASTDQSVARWRREMPEELVARFGQEMGDDLAELGYGS